MANGYSQVHHHRRGADLDFRRSGTTVDNLAGGTLAVALSLGWGLYLVRDKKEGV